MIRDIKISYMYIHITAYRNIHLVYYINNTFQIKVLSWLRVQKNIFQQKKKMLEKKEY